MKAVCSTPIELAVTCALGDASRRTAYESTPAALCGTRARMKRLLVKKRELQRWLASKVWQLRSITGAEFNERTPAERVVPVPPVIALPVISGVAAVPLLSITLTP